MENDGRHPLDKTAREIELLNKVEELEKQLEGRANDLAALCGVCDDVSEFATNYVLVGDHLLETWSNLLMNMSGLAQKLSDNTHENRFEQLTAKNEELSGYLEIAQSEAKDNYKQLSQLRKERDEAVEFLQRADRILDKVGAVEITEEIESFLSRISK